MKKSFIFSLIPAVLLLAVWGCKKGENDPGISLKSRTGRLAGEWKLESGTVTYTYGSSTSTTTYNGTTATVTAFGGSFTDSYTETYEIEKSGSYSKTTIDDGDVTNEDGVWAWVDGSKDAELANKEAIMLSPTKTMYQSGNVTTYSGIVYSTILTLDKLSSKELVVVIKNSIVGTSGYTSQTDGTMTYTKK